MPKRKSQRDLEQEEDAALVPVVPTALLPVQQTFIEHLLSGKSIVESSLASGISRRTACRWLEPDHAVSVEYEKQRLGLLQEFRSRISALTGRALDTLAEALQCDDLKTRVDAAKFLYTANLQHIPAISFPAPAENLLAQYQEKERTDQFSALIDGMIE